MQDENKIFVRKNGNVKRNLERYDVLLGLKLSIPKIYEIYGDSYDMEYIFGLDIKKYLSINPIDELASFIEKVIDTFSENTIEKDFRPIYSEKLTKFDFQKYTLPFSAESLFQKLPAILPSSEYHGDFTLENILYDVKNKKFVLIDPLTTEYNSFVFDLAKLRQDLTCGWFIRNDENYFDSKLKVVSEKLLKYEQFNNDYLLILMLMRILPYAKNKQDEEFLIKEIHKLWK
jgi:hypothetical protein